MMIKQILILLYDLDELIADDVRIHNKTFKLGIQNGHFHTCFPI